MRRKILKNKIVTIDESLAIFEPIYALSRRNVLVKSVEYFASPPLLVEAFAPFADWKKRNVPTWWNAYNAIKHNMTKNLKKANVENTMMALGGAFLLNAIYEPSVICLARTREAKLGRYVKLGVHRFYRHETSADWDRIRKIITNHLLKKNEYVNVQTRFFMIQYRKM